jgi:hypothetical protein
MTAPSCDWYQLLKLTLKHKTDLTTHSLYLTSRPVIRATLDGAAIYPYPLINSIPELGAEATEGLPKFLSGNISLINTQGTFGRRRKLSDLLERYTIHAQAFDLYVAAMAADAEVAAFVAADKVWGGTIESFSVSPGAASSFLNLQTTLDPVPDRPMCYQIDEDVTGWEDDSPEYSLGKYLPVIFGDGAAPWHLVSGPEKAAPNYQYYAVDAKLNNYASTTSSTVWGIDHDGVAVLCDILGGMGGNTYGLVGASAGTRVAFADAEEHGVKMTGPATGGIIVAGVAIKLYGNGNTSCNAILQARVYRVNSTTEQPEDVVAQGSFDLATVAAYNTSANVFVINIMFSGAVVLNFDENDYAVALTISGWETNDPSWDQTTDATEIYKKASGQYEFENLTTTLGSETAAPGYCKWITMQVYQAYASDADINGFAARVYDLRENSGFGSYPSAPVSNMDGVSLFSKLTKGISDDTSGTLTGTANLELKRVDHALKLCSLKWNGTAWASSGWSFTESDQTAHYATYYAASGRRTRQVQGFLEGYATTEEVIRQLCKDTATRIGVNNSGLLFPWVWGPEYDAVDTIDPRDVILESYEERDLTSVINNVSISYGKSYAAVDYARNIGSGQVANFGGTIKGNSESTNHLKDAAGPSVDLYGQRPLEDIETSFIGTETAALTLAEYYLSVYQHPWKIAVISVPYQKYKALRMFDVINVAHPGLPTYYGAWSDDRGAAGYGELVDIANGRDLIRAQSYRAIIEGRYIVANKNEAPLLRLKLRLLTNEADPT